VVYLLDANVLITAHRGYYPIDAFPEVWDWLVYMGVEGKIKMPIETFEEVKDGSNDAERDLLFDWIKHGAHKAAILFAEDVQPALVQSVINQYAPDLRDDELEHIGRDPFLIAHALADRDNRCVVTTEVSKPKKMRQHRRIPDVCTDIGVQCCDTFAMLKKLGFRTDWRRHYNKTL
jgi:hypothetical protein